MGNGRGVLNIEEETDSAEINKVLIIADAALTSGNQLQAIENYNSALKLLNDCSSPIAGTILLKTGDAYRDLGNIDKAKEYYASALAILKLHEDNCSRLDVLITEGNMAHIANDFVEAEKLYHEALNVIQKYFSKVHLKNAIVYRKLGDVFRDSGEHNKALDFYKKDWSILKKHFCPGHLGLASTLRKFGFIYQCQGNYLQAKIHYELALDIKRNHSDGNPMSTVNAMNALGNIYCELGHIKQARRILEEAIAIIKECYGQSSNRYMTDALKWVAKVDEKEKVNFSQRKALPTTRHTLWAEKDKPVAMEGFGLKLPSGIVRRVG